jgi:indole-3-glycerol phosphate synthase
MTGTKSSESVLHKIGALARQRVETDKQRQSQAELQAAWQAHEGRKPKDFRSLFTRAGLQVIAEVKRASPSKGDIAAHLDPVQVAQDYLQNGAAALSVLTEPHYFKGDLAFLQAIRRQHPEAYLLQKDFVVDPYQLYQAALAGADAILIIVALLGEADSARILKLARDLGLSALVEVHDAEELAIAERIGADLIGINNRNLKDLSISLDVTRRLLPACPQHARIICESGLETRQDLLDMQSLGCHGFLVGTSLMRTGEPGPALRRLIHGAG